MNEVEARQCGQKLRYPNHEYATRAVKVMHKKYKAPFEAYPCRHCGFWHVGTVRSPEAGKRRAARQTA